MYDYGLIEKIEEVSVQRFKKALAEELTAQKEMPDNSAWLFSFSDALKHALALGNGSRLAKEIQAAEAAVLKKCVLLEIEYQRVLMVGWQGKQTNNFRPFVSFLRAVLKRLEGLGRSDDESKAES